MTVFASYLIVASAALLAGAMMGFYTAHADIERKRRGRIDRPH